MFSLLWTAIIGLVVGLIARFLLPGRDPMGLIMTALLGIAGSFIGTFAGRALFRNNYSAGIIMSVLGAMLLLWLYRMVAGRNS